jgi:hypothetical protein
MNLIDLKKQIKNKDSNFFFKRDSLVKSYFINILKVYDYAETLNEYKATNEGKLITIFSDKILLNSDHVDLAHAKHEALAILDYIENKIKNDFAVSVVSGTSNGIIKLFIANGNLYQTLISLKFIKNKSRVELKGQLNLNHSVQKLLDETSFNNGFKPYLISLYPIQLNDKKVMEYGIKVAKKIKNSLIHDTSETEHSIKAKLTSQLKIPYSISYGVKDLAESTLNVYHHPSQKYSRVKLSKLDEALNEINRIIRLKDSIKEIYSCKSKKCLDSLNKLEGILITTFNQIIQGKTCDICSKDAKEKFINIKVGDSI